jgi:dipeptidyl aminopeptidase/acylaminoacyl peptidase
MNDDLDSRMPAQWLIGSTLLLLGAFLCRNANGQEAPSSEAASAPLALSTAMEVNTMGGRPVVSLSSDGRHLVYPVCTPRRETPTGGAPPGGITGDTAPYWVEGCRLLIADVRPGKAPALKEELGAAWNGIWSPSGTRLAYVATDSGKPTLYVKEPARPARLVGRTHPWHMPWWIGDDRIAYVSPRAPTASGADPTKDTPLLLHSAVRRATVTVYRSPADLSAAERELVPNVDSTTGDPGIPQTWQADFVVCDLRTGKQTVLERGAGFPYAPPTVVAVSPDRRLIAYNLYHGTVRLKGIGYAVVDVVVTPVGRPADRQVIASGVTVSRSNQSLTWSPDGRYLAWFIGGFTDNGNLMVYDTRRRKVRRVLPAEPPGDSVPHLDAGRWTLAQMFAEPAPVWRDGRTVLTKVYRGPADTRPELKQATEIWTIDVASGEARRVGAVPGGRIWGILTRAGSSRAWLHGHELMLWVHTDGQDDVLGAMDLKSGRYRPVTGGHYSFLQNSPTPIPTASADGRSALLVRQSATEPPDVWLQPADGGPARALTRVNPGLSFEGFGKSVVLSYRNADGKLLHAALKLPADYTPGHRLPLIVNTYVVTHWSFLANQFDFESGPDNPLLLTSRGYGVLMPDVPVEAGKTGGDGIAAAVLAGVDAAVRAGYADPERLGITGHSYGGYAVYSTIVRTKRFHAAVARSGFADWIPDYLSMSPNGSSAWGISNAEGPRGPGGTLWDKREQFIEDSPLFFFDRIETPVLIVHGTADYVSDINAKMPFVALRRLGKDVTLALYEGEDHVQGEYSIPNQQDYFERKIKWFDRYLCPRRVSATSCTR